MPGMFDEYPYTDFHEMNLDFVLDALKSLDARVKALEDAASGEEDEENVD